MYVHTNFLTYSGYFLLAFRLCNSADIRTDSEQLYNTSGIDPMQLLTALLLLSNALLHVLL